MAVIEYNPKTHIVLDIEGSVANWEDLDAMRHYANVLERKTHLAAAQLIREIADAIEAQRPKPAIEEPQGLGAVVEDVTGKRWVRTDDPDWPWDSRISCGAWGDLDAVKVLSQGVS